MKDMHPDADDIAAYDEDLLSEEAAARLREHLATCDACTDVRAELAALRHHLRAIPAPPLPDDVAQRIDAALAAVSRETAADAGALPGTPTGTPATDTPARTTPSRATRRIRGYEGRRLRMVLAAAGALVAVGLGGTLLQVLGSQTADGGAADESGTEAGEVAASDDELGRQVQELLAASESPSALAAEPEAATPSEAPESEDGSANLGTEALPDTSLPACVTDGIGRSDPPLAAESTEYQGQDAYLVVFAGTADPEDVEAYVVDAGCTTHSTPGEILDQGTYPRG